MSKSKNITFKISLTINSTDVGRVEILKEVLVQLGANLTEIIELDKLSSTILEVYSPAEGKVKRLQEGLENMDLKGVKTSIMSLQKKDWQDTWKKDFKPFVLTQRFEVVPVWLKETYVSRREAVYVDTSLAFGTGLHETTRFMSGLIERCSGQFHSFFDIGTGTGILAIIALKCGAQEVKAVDISEDSVKVARLNFEENGCKVKDLKVANIQSFRERRQYDFVAANLVTHDLIQFGAKILGYVKPGKYLAVSGISIENFKMFKENFKKYPLRCMKIERGEKWVACLYRRANDV